MGQRRPRARSCLFWHRWRATEGLRAGMGQDVPRLAPLALGTSRCQQRAGEGGMLSFSSRLPAGKNSYGPRVPVYRVYL